MPHDAEDLDGSYPRVLNWTHDAGRRVPGGRDVWYATGAQLSTMVSLEVEGPWQDRTWSYKLFAPDDDFTIDTGAGRTRVEAMYNAERAARRFSFL